LILRPQFFIYLRPTKVKTKTVLAKTKTSKNGLKTKTGLKNYITATRHISCLQIIWAKYVLKISYFTLKSLKVVSFRPPAAGSLPDPHYLRRPEVPLRTSLLKFLDLPLLIIQCNVIKFFYTQKS